MRKTRSGTHPSFGTALLLAAGFCGTTHAGPADVAQGADALAAEIEEVVVVAHKQARSAREIAANVTVLSGDAMRFELGATIADAFRYAPGVDFEAAGARFGAESINIRGISGNRVAVLVDGVPVSDQFDVGNFSNATRDLVDSGFIEHVEVLHGPASALYGSSAIGGVVTMSTVDPRHLAAQGGSGGRLVSNWRGDNAALSGTALQVFGSDSMALVAGISSTGAGEYDSAAVEDNLDRRDIRSTSGLLKFVIDDAAGNTWQALLQRRESDVESSLESMLGTGRFRTTTALLGDDTSKSDMAGLEYRFGNASRLVDEGVLRAFYQGTDVVQMTVDERAAAARPVTIDRLFAFEQRSHGLEANLQKQFATASLRHRVGFGFEYRSRDTAEYRDGLETGLVDGLQTNVLLGEVFPLRDFPLSATEEWGAYLEDTVSIGAWSIIGALRADRFDMQPAIDAMYAEDYPFAEPVSISESELSPKLGVIYRFSDAAEAYVQYAHGFRAPPYEDANISLELPLFNMRAVPNPDLRSERSDGYDVGLRWRGMRGNARVSVFRTEYEDFIESRVRVGTDPDSGRILFQSQNLDSAVIEGVEAGTTVMLDTLLAGLSVDMSLFVARSENRENGEALNSVGPPQAVIGIDWAPTDGTFRASLRSTLTDDWSHRDETGGPLFQPPGYAVYDMFVAWSLGTRLTLRAAALNLTDRTYWAWTDVRGLAPDDPVIPYLSRPGRSFGVGFDMRW